MERMTDVDPKPLAESLRSAVDALLMLQRDDGHWCAELQGDSILCSEYLLMKFILGQEREPFASGADGWTSMNRIANGLRAQQRDDGTWGQYPGATIDVSATTKGYFALKLMGDDTRALHMKRAREAILDAGGAECCNSFSNFYLACLGQVSWRAIPAIPPEIIWLPKWFYFNLDNVSAWTRTMILPLAIVTTMRPTRKLPRALGVDELYVNQRDRHRLTFLHRKSQLQDGLVSWTTAFRAFDFGLKIAHHAGGSPVRRLAVKHAEEWILQRAGQDGISATAGLGAIFPPMVYLQIALQTLGYDRAHPVIKRAERELDEFFIEEDDQIRIQPCFSPVWDTGIALYALTDCGMTSADVPVANAANWLRSKQVEHIGDWARNLRPDVRAKYERDGTDRPAGWAFEYDNAWYPDVDDTAMVAMALRRAGGADNINAATRGVEWIFDMQNDDGGWAAFDRTRDRPILEKVPFADHNAMQDPSCPDITGRVLECLSWHGYDMTDVRVVRAVDYIKSKQQPEGCWFGRWGVNYIYGTWQAVIGPIRCGVPRGLPWVKRAAEWLKDVQHDDGSFGESADSYGDPLTKGVGPATASQTAWAAMVLQEVCGPNDPNLARAIEWLVEHQMTESHASDAAWNVDGDPAGSWRETEFTGTGFPEVFYLRYHLYRLYFPLMAIARYARAHGVERDELTDTKPIDRGDRDVQRAFSSRERELVGR